MTSRRRVRASSRRRGRPWRPGRPWRARDLLAAHVESERDPEALALLAQVHHDMGDLPRAGAIWFAAGAKGPEVDAAVAAWRTQADDDFGVMWRSLPASVRAEPRPRRIEALRERARAVGARAEERDGRGIRPTTTRPRTTEASTRPGSSRGCSRSRSSCSRSSGSSPRWAGSSRAERRPSGPDGGRRPGGHAKETRSTRAPRHRRSAHGSSPAGATRSTGASTGR